jgi:hypothetical protein
MEKDGEIRKLLVKNLTGSHAHMDFDEAVKNFPMAKINEVFPKGEYSAWGLLEHIRRTQNDILEFIESAEYKEKEWPKDYWPDKKYEARKEDWEKTIKLFKADQEKLVKIIEDPETDLYAKILWGDGQSIFQEIILVIDHNSYHIGEFGIMRQVMGTW